jgi:4,5-dihydroxyphthalate decarboxylase
MSKLKLTFACGLYDRMLALRTGDEQPAGIDLNFVVMDNPRQIFDRMAGGLEFDLAEMSSSEYISQVARGGSPFVALPVFPSRVFRHGFIVVNRQSGIDTPKDLAGKRIGVPLYTMSAAVWIRGHLQHEHGVDLSGVRWVQGAINAAMLHGDPAAPPMARPVRIERETSGKSLSDLIDAREIDAIIGTGMPAAMNTNPHVQRLFPNFREVEKAFYRKTRIHPIMHLVVIKREVYERHPSIATSLYNAFREAKDWALQKMRFIGALRYMLPWLAADLDEIDEVFGGDPWPYGIEDNRPTLEALVTYLHEQGIIGTRPRIEDLFVPTYGAPDQGH